MISNIELLPGEFGIKAVFKSKWEENYISFLLQNNVVELELNHAKGWFGNDVDFLKYFPDLKSLTIIDFNSILKSINGVHYLHNLQVLNVSTYCKTPIDFNFFPKLKSCVFEWRKGSETLFECKTLNKLFLNNYNKEGSKVFTGLKELENLSILNAPLLELSGLSSLKQLKYLRIGNLKKLKSLQDLKVLPSLEKLEIYSCKGINSISEIFNLPNLNRLALLNSGEIKSIKGIENLKELETFLFYESTNIADGDLRPLFKLKKLSKISFQNRKHYTNKREEFGKLYFG